MESMSKLFVRECTSAEEVIFDTTNPKIFMTDKIFLH